MKSESRSTVIFSPDSVRCCGHHALDVKGIIVKKMIVHLQYISQCI